MRPDLTLLIVRSGHAARADFAGGRRALFQAAAVPGGTLPEGVEAALGLSGRPARKVFVLSDLLWSQAIAVPAAAVSELDGKGLAQALAFEAEPLSGIPAGEAALGWARAETADLPDRSLSRYSIVETPAADRDRIARLIRDKGGLLAGLLHPAGLRGAASGTAEDGFGRVESWPERVEGWAGALSGPEDPGVPRIRPSREAAPARSLAAAGAAAFAAVVLVCLGHAAFSARREGALRAQAEGLGSLSRRAGEARKEIAALVAQRDRLAEEVRVKEASRTRLVSILRAIGRAAPADLAVERIEPNGGGVAVAGFCLDASAPDVFAARLSEETAAAGLRAEATEKSRAGNDPAGAWQYVILVGGE